MTLFENGHEFALCVRCCPPLGYPVPVIYAQMTGPGGEARPVIGKVDTGASRTVLNFDTAADLGIADPKQGAIGKGTARTATDAEFDYYVHGVMVTVADDQGNPDFFLLEAAFAEKVKRNLFGVDWLPHVCLAVDREAVYLLRD